MLRPTRPRPKILDLPERQDLRRCGEQQPGRCQAAFFLVGMAQAGELRRTQRIGLEQFCRVGRPNSAATSAGHGGAWSAGPAP